MSTVIKADQQNPKLIRRLATVNVADHLGEAKLVLATSRERAQELLRETQVEADVLRRQAAEAGYESGFRRGYAAGSKAGYDAAFAAAWKSFESQQTSLIAALTSVIDEYERQKRDLFIAAASDVSEFAMKVAEKVTKQVGAVNRAAATANMEHALRLVESKTDVIVQINALDKATMERFASSVQERASASRNFHFEADESIEPGGCRLRAAGCEVDASLAAQIAQIASLMAAPTEAPT